MGGGLMQLVAMGAQDVYLTGNPQITFFKVVYRRHTNFSKECIAQTFSGSIPSTAEGSVTCTLARNGDLVQEIYLKTTVEANPSDVSLALGATTFANASGVTATNAINTVFSNGDTVYFDKDIKFSDAFTLVKNTNVKIGAIAGGNKIFAYSIKYGRWFNAISRLRRTRHISYG